MVYSMTEGKPTMNDQWMDIVKTVIVYVAPFVVIIWKITDRWAEIQKQRLTDSLTDAVRNAVDPKFNEMNVKIDEIKRRQDHDRRELDQKLEKQTQDFNAQLMQIIRDQRK